MPIIKCINPKCRYHDLGGPPDNCSHPIMEIQKCNNAIIEKTTDLTHLIPVNFYFKELRSDECWCGNSKKPGYSFCYLDYGKLPKELKFGLWSKIGEGYEQAYDVAVKYLEKL